MNYLNMVLLVLYSVALGVWSSNLFTPFFKATGNSGVFSQFRFTARPDIDMDLISFVIKSPDGTIVTYDLRYDQQDPLDPESAVLTQLSLSDSYAANRYLFESLGELGIPGVTEDGSNVHFLYGYSPAIGLSLYFNVGDESVVLRSYICRTIASSRYPCLDD